MTDKEAERGFVLGEKQVKILEGRWEKARYTIDITIGDKSITVKDLELCHFCQVMIRDRIEDCMKCFCNG